MILKIHKEYWLKKKEDKKILLDKKNHYNYWLNKWLDKRKFKRQKYYINYLKSIIPKEKFYKNWINGFFSMVDIGCDDDCWNWLGSCDKDGYGRYGRVKICNTVRVHRLSYILFYGKYDILDDVVVMHRCDNVKCINPKHLFIGSFKDNVLDMMNKNRQANGNFLPQSKLTLIKANEIREKYKNGKIVNDLVRDYDVNYGTIRGVLSNETWKDNKYIPPLNYIRKKVGFKLDLIYVYEILEKHKNKKSVTDLSKEYNISRATVKKIIRYEDLILKSKL